MSFSQLSTRQNEHQPASRIQENNRDASARRFHGTGLKYATIALTLSAAAFVLVTWGGSSGIKHYTAEELAGLSCEALGELHEEVIFAYHDAEIAHKRRTGAFHDDLGMPLEDVVPYAVLIKKFINDNGIAVADITDRSTLTPILNSGFYYEVSRICATNPSWQATDAMRQAAENLGLIDV